MTTIGLSAGHEAHYASLTRKLAGSFSQVFALWSRRAAISRAEKQLAAFDDRMLEDVGLLRSDIPSAVRGLEPVDDRPVPYWSR